MKNIEKSKAYKAAYGKKKGQQYDEIVTEQPRRGRRSGDGGNYVQRVTNDEREDEMDENLQSD